MTQSLLESKLDWLSGEGPDADVAVFCQGRLMRNLSDLPFPNQCNEEEKATIEERVVGGLDSLNLLESGKYWSSADIEARKFKLLAERRLISRDSMRGTAAQGIYVSDDQALSVSVNEDNHLTTRALSSGLDLQDVWNRLNMLDDSLGGMLDFAFNERLGYLTTAVADLGCALKLGVVLHLPVLTTHGEISKIQEQMQEKRHRLEPMYGTKAEAMGDLYLLENISSLGRSEEETIFHLRHLAGELVEQERQARERMRSEAPLQLEDRVGRALGIARGARLLAFEEALSVLSSIRLGISNGLLDQYSLHQLNEILMSAHNAHIETKRGEECDELSLNAERAGLFRSCFT